MPLKQHNISLNKRKLSLFSSLKLASIKPLLISLTVLVGIFTLAHVWVNNQNEEHGITYVMNSATALTLADNLRYINQVASDASNPTTNCTEPWEEKNDILAKGDSKFPCTGILHYRHHGQPLRGCGHPFEYTKNSHPLGWECRLKEELHTIIVEEGLSTCAFGFLDIGTMLGDWVVALSGFENAKFAVVEAHPGLFLKMLRTLKVNNLLDEHVSVYPCAVGFSDNNVTLSNEYANISWPDSKYVKVTSWPGPTLCVPNPDGSSQVEHKSKEVQVIGSDRCSNTKSAVPIISVDMIMDNWQQKVVSKFKWMKPALINSNDRKLPYGGLFAMKVDIEGAERDAVKSASISLADPNQRPCVMYFEIKIGPEYDEAFAMILELGYTVYMDIDSGLVGKESYPPKGVLWEREGNYEFRLPEKEFKECIARVKRVTCPIS